MKARGRSEEPGRQTRGTSRDSSVSSSGREVRCACQYFQSDSLLPERVPFAGRPPSRTSQMATQIGDHEYEPISPPADPQQPPQTRLTMDMDVEMELGVASKKREGSQASSTDSRERRFLRIPLDDELVVPGDGEAEDAAMGGREMGDTINGNGHEDVDADADAERELSAQELQAQMEERYFANTPTTESRTDCDVNTSQLDSSGLEDLPLKRDARKKKQQDGATDKQTEARGLQQKIRSQAGRIRTKLRNMSRPKFSMPERPKFNLPERPKFSMPERPKFNLPERPKFNLPERPKFNLPERPKFNLPERPKFTMPERPKFNLPQRPKLTMKSISLSKSSPKKPTSSTRRPLRDRPSTISTASSKKNLFDFDFKSYPRIFDRKSRANADYATSSPKQTRAQTPPPKMPSRKKGPVGQRWLHRFTDIKYADENMPELGDDEDEAMGARGGIGRDIQNRMDISNDERFNIDDREGGERPGSTHTESTSAFRDKDYGYAITMVDNSQPQQEKNDQPSNSIPESDREQRSSGSSSDRRRAGVLEEIDSDEFFLREKGLSQEDVDVGRYLTSEIRDAFRSPVSALSQMDKYDYYDDEEDMENLGQQYRGTPEREPTRPARTRSLRPRKREGKNKTPSPPVEEDSSQFFNTFPPTRPKRVRRQPEQIQNQDEQIQPDQPQEGIETEEEPGVEIEDEEIEEKEEKMHDVGSVNQEVSAVNEESLEQEIGTAGLEKPVSDIQRISPTIKVSVPEEEFIQNVIEYQEEDFPEQSEENWNAEDELTSASNAPLVPKRKRRSRRDLLQDLPQEPICNGSYTKEDWLENIESRIVADEVAALRMEPDYIIPASPDEEYFEEPPVPPKRGRRKGSRGTSLIDEDRTSRGAESLPSERDVAADDIACDISLNDMGGYASVEKPSKPEPAKRRPKPPRPPPPGRRKRSVGQIRVTTNDISHFFSLPRKAIRAPPVRPVRNYSTLGPSRPPRRERVIEHEYTEQEQKSEAYMEIEDTDLSLRHEESHGSTRDLQSGDVIEKMKGRPLPPPPRPPRKGREGKDSQEVEESSEGLKDLTGGEGKLEIEAYKEEPMAALSDSVFYSKQEPVSAYDQYQDEVSAGLEEERAVSPSHLMTEKDMEPEEVSVATQTDPLPDDFCVEAGDIDEQQEPPILADASTETTASSVFKSSVDIQTDTRTEPSEEKVTAAPVQRVETSQFESFRREEKPPPEVPTRPPEPVIIERPVPYYVMPDPDTEVELKAQRLQVSELDVERLNVGELQAQKIMVSDIDGMSMQVAELSSKSGHLVVSGIELPTGFLQELVDSRSRPPSVVTPESTQVSPPPTVVSPQSPAATQETVISSSAPPTETSEQVPSTPKQVDTPVIQAETISSPPTSSVPPQAPSAARSRSHVHNIQSVPPESIHSYIPEYSPSIPPTVRGSSRSRAHVSAVQRDFGSEEEMINLVPTHSSRRRRHYSRPPVLRDSSDEDEEEDLASFHPPTRRHQSRPGEPSVGELGRQMVQACQAATMRAIRHTLQYANSHLHEGEDKRRDLQIALCLLLALVAALILMGFGRGKTFHYHHWDYLFPPTR